MEPNRAKYESGSLSICEFMVHKTACAAKTSHIAVYTLTSPGDLTLIMEFEWVGTVHQKWVKEGQFSFWQ
jgi:hypothetical protein